MVVINIEYLGTINDQYVYDIETEDGTFYAYDYDNNSIYDSINDKLDPGILLKNTDSCYAAFEKLIDKNDYMIDNKFDQKGFMDKSFEISKLCASFISAKFKSPIKIEFEKIMYPFMIFQKKRYAYMHWDNSDGPLPEIECKGLAIKRRDSCKYVKEVCNGIINILMNPSIELGECSSREELALIYTENCIKNLLEGNVDTNNLIISNQLKNEYKMFNRVINWIKPLKTSTGEIRMDKNNNPIYDDLIYQIKKPHVQIAINMRKKDPVNYPKPPERVPYLYIMKDNVKYAYEQAIHANEYIKNKNQINYVYYFEHQLKNPVGQILELLFEQTTSTKSTGKIKSYIINGNKIEKFEHLYNTYLINSINKLNKQSNIFSFFKSENIQNNIIIPNITQFSLKEEGFDDDIDNENDTNAYTIK